MTFWNLLSSAASFSMYFLYSSSVVAPIFTIINIFVVALQALGAFVFIKALSELAVSIPREDNVGIASAIKGMIAGVMLISVRLLLKLCGVNI